MIKRIKSPWVLIKYLQWLKPPCRLSSSQKTKLIRVSPTLDILSQFKSSTKIRGMKSEVIKERLRPKSKVKQSKQRKHYSWKTQYWANQKWRRCSKILPTFNQQPVRKQNDQRDNGLQEKETWENRGSTKCHLAYWVTPLRQCSPTSSNNHQDIRSSLWQVLISLLLKWASHHVSWTSGDWKQRVEDNWETSLLL